jgi:hypothetical protein
MPWWASLYLAGYVAFTAWSIASDIRTKENSRWFVAAQILGDLCLVIAALAFWDPELRALLRPLLIPLFSAGLAVLIVQMATAVRRYVVADPELSFHGKLVVGAAGTSLMAVISAPLVYWGFSAAVLDRIGG